MKKSKEYTSEQSDRKNKTGNVHESETVYIPVCSRSVDWSVMPGNFIKAEKKRRIEKSGVNFYPEGE